MGVSWNYCSLKKFWEWWWIFCWNRTEPKTCSKQWFCLIISRIFEFKIVLGLSPNPEFLSETYWVSADRCCQFLMLLLVEWNSLIFHYNIFGDKILHWGSAYYNSSSAVVWSRFSLHFTEHISSRFLFEFFCIHVWRQIFDDHSVLRLTRVLYLDAESLLVLFFSFLLVFFCIEE